MHMQPGQGEKGIAAIGSMTAAIKAQRALQGAGFAVDVIALSPGETRRGCAYGIEYPADMDARVRTALRLAHISVSQYLRKGGKAP